jgi:quinolinate synthase
MLWQPSLPDIYTKMPDADLAAAISQRRKELGKDLVILGHHYQTDEVIQHADYTGDSLKLSQIAAKLSSGLADAPSPPKYIMFCGVHFMAETADLLTPPEVAVILPDLSAGCSMADMAQYDDTVQAWNDIHASLREQGWQGRIVPITYVNSSAAIKAFVGQHAGACCTSSNALEVFKWAKKEGQKVLFLPDQHLGRNTAAKFGINVATRSCVYDPRLTRKGAALGGATPIQLLESDAILWAGHCSVHKLFRPEHCDQIREQNKIDAAKGIEPMQILVHPECCKEVVDKADLNGSTEYIIKTIEQAKSGTRWVVGTEVHLVNRIAKAAQARGVHVRILSDCQCLCTTMYRIDQPHMLWVLDNLAGKFEERTNNGKQPKARIVNQIIVPKEVREPALLAIDRMLSLTATPSPTAAQRLEQLATAD